MKKLLYMSCAVAFASVVQAADDTTQSFEFKPTQLKKSMTATTTISSGMDSLAILAQQKKLRSTTDSNGRRLSHTPAVTTKPPVHPPVRRNSASAATNTMPTLPVTPIPVIKMTAISTEEGSLMLPSSTAISSTTSATNTATVAYSAVMPAQKHSLSLHRRSGSAEVHTASPSVVAASKLEVLKEDEELSSVRQHIKQLTVEIPHSPTVTAIGMPTIEDNFMLSSTASMSTSLSASTTPAIAVSSTVSAASAVIISAAELTSSTGINGKKKDLRTERAERMRQLQSIAKYSAPTHLKTKDEIEAEKQKAAFAKAQSRQQLEALMSSASTVDNRLKFLIGEMEKIAGLLAGNLDSKALVKITQSIKGAKLAYEKFLYGQPLKVVETDKLAEVSQQIKELAANALSTASDNARLKSHWTSVKTAIEESGFLTINKPKAVQKKSATLDDLKKQPSAVDIMLAQLREQENANVTQAVSDTADSTQSAITASASTATKATVVITTSTTAASMPSTYTDHYYN